MKTNELKKGQRVRLSYPKGNRWQAVLKDNMRGNTRLATVEGDYTETGSVYAHDIVEYLHEDGMVWLPVTHTDKQLKLKEQVNALLGRDR